MQVIALKLTAAEIEAIEFTLDKYPGFHSRTELIRVALIHELMRHILPDHLWAEIRLQRDNVITRRRRKKAADTGGKR